jgi:hypothetical protein
MSVANLVAVVAIGVQFHRALGCIRLACTCDTRARLYEVAKEL